MMLGGKLLNGIKGMYSSACVRVKGGESERFRIDIGVRQGCIISPWLFNIYIDGSMKKVKMGMGKREVAFLEDGRELRLLLYADELVLCVDSEEDLRAMADWFVEVLRRRGLKINAGKSKLMVLNGEEGLECEVHVDGVLLEHVSKLKYLGCVLDESGTDWAECSRNVASRKRVAGTIRSLVNAGNLQIECARVLHETLIVPVLTYDSEKCYGRRRRDLGLGLYR